MGLTQFSGQISIPTDSQSHPLNIRDLPLELIFKIFDHLKIADLSSIYELFPELVMNYAKYRKISYTLAVNLTKQLSSEQVIHHTLHTLDEDTDKIVYCVGRYWDYDPYCFSRIPKSMFRYKFRKEYMLCWEFTENKILIRYNDKHYDVNGYGIFLLPKYEMFIRGWYGDPKDENID